MTDRATPKAFLRPARTDDLEFILGLEWRDDYQGFITRLSLSQHRHNLTDPDLTYLIASVDDRAVGFVILAGLNRTDRIIELRRIVVDQPGKGLGRAVLTAVLDHVFTELRPHRLWLDVVIDNERARRAYLAVGFREEGVLREAIYLGGRYQSLRIMSVLESDYPALKEK